MRVAVVIATRNRPNHLPQVLQAVMAQDLTPVGIVVADSSDDPLFRSLRVPPDTTTPVLHERVTEASLPHQRNIGCAVAFARFDPEFICFIDDDVRPSRDYLSRLAHLLNRDTVDAIAGVSGTSGWTRTSVRRRYALFNRLFLLSGAADGRMLRSGYNMPVDALSGGVQTAQWLFGCSMWRSSILRQYRFHDGLVGSALFEDVEFSIRVGKSYGLLVDTSARLEHLLEQDQRPGNRLHYERLIRNRAEVIKALRPDKGGWLAFWWSALGDILLVVRHIHSSSDYRERLSGLLRGVARTVTRRQPR